MREEQGMGRPVTLTCTSVGVVMHVFMDDGTAYELRRSWEELAEMVVGAGARRESGGLIREASNIIRDMMEGGGPSP